LICQVPAGPTPAPATTRPSSRARTAPPGSPSPSSHVTVPDGQLSGVGACAASTSSPHCITNNTTSANVMAPAVRWRVVVRSMVDCIRTVNVRFAYGDVWALVGNAPTPITPPKFLLGVHEPASIRGCRAPRSDPTTCHRTARQELRLVSFAQSFPGQYLIRL
jgi:hypothetical protein